MGPISHKKGGHPGRGLAAQVLMRGWGSVSTNTANTQTTQMSVLHAARKREGLQKTPENHGAGYKIRTRDPLITNQVLYQLS